MSSLLDILHRTERPTTDELQAPEPLVNDPEDSIELRLAIDNPAPTPYAMRPRPATEAKVVGGSDSRPAAGRGADTALSAQDLRQRSRRNTVLLTAGLVLIVVAAGAATWLLQEVRIDATGKDSMFVSPDGNAAPAPAVKTGTVERTVPPAEAPAVPRPPASREAQPATTPVVVPPTASDESPDPDWFDLPAIDETESAPAADVIRIVRGTTTNPLFPTLTEAWTAFQAGDFARSESLYREVSKADVGNVDALLGLAALALRGSRADEAQDFYQRVLTLEPKNAAAISGLSTLPAAASRSLDESTLKSLLREQPGAASLHFALGLRYVAEGRWPDAQVAFFDAVRNEPGNADYAYNLAVSLDRLGQSGPATAWYQRALDTATASALFTPGVAQDRLAVLQAVTP